MKQGYTRAAFILDRSGSMELLREAAVEAVNSFVREQLRLPGSMRLKLVQFDTQYDVVFDKDLRDTPQFTQADFTPRGWTALFDAQCKTIDELGAELAALPEDERPERVIVVTMTDGLENASKQYTRSDVLKRIETQRDQFNWAFIYLGANQDAVAEGRGMGMKLGASMTYANNARAVANTMAATNSYVRGLRSMPVGQSVNSIAFSDKDRLEAMQHEDTPAHK